MPTPSARVGKRIAFLLEHEPSWFSEFICSLGAFLWGVFLLSTPLYALDFKGYVMATIGVALWPIRIVFLLRLNPLPRVALASFEFMWWAVVLVGMYHFRGLLPLSGAAVALAVGDILTVGKFSLWARRLSREREALHGARVLGRN